MKDWTKEAVFYHIYPLGFCGCEQFHQEVTTNRIKKIEEWIPHLKKMNITAVYLGPIFESYEHGYDTSDYRMLDHRLGSNVDFHRVCDALHEAGIHIVLDGVFNHVGRNFWAFQDIQNKGATSPYCSWFHNLDFSKTSPFKDTFTYEAWEGHYNLVKLNLQNEEVIQYLLDSVGMWMDEFGIDGLRLDAADCIDRNFFKRLKQYCKEKKPNFWLMGEIIHGDYTMWANDEMLDSVTNYECYKGLYSSHNEKNYFEIAYSLNRQFGNDGIYKNLNLYNFVDNHDVNRLASTLKNHDDIFNVYTLLFTIPGIPSIYYGSEFEIEGTKHNGSDADIRPTIVLQEELAKNNPLLELIAQLASLKKTHPALSMGSYEQLIVRNQQFVFRRIYNEETLYILFNVSDGESECRFSCHEENLLDLLSQKTYTCDQKILTITLAPKTAYILGKASLQKPEKKDSVITNKKLNTKKAEERDPHIQSVEAEEKQKSFPFPSMNIELALGRYEHYKGKHYNVIYVATHSETIEKYVVYRQLYGNEQVWIRPLKMFQENVLVDGKEVPRFRFLSK